MNLAAANRFQTNVDGGFYIRGRGCGIPKKLEVVCCYEKEKSYEGGRRPSIRKVGSCERFLGVLFERWRLS
jgi:hypothetical protein